MQVQPFSEQTGPTTAIPCLISEVFLLFFSMGIMELIVNQTNLYASQVMGPEKFAAWEQVTVTELKAYFKGRVYFVQYMPDKPTKWGMKFFVLANSSCGYTPGDCIQVRISIQFECLEHKGHYCDNYYCSPVLFNDLRQLGTGACSTVRLNRRGLPEKIMSKSTMSKEDVRSKMGRNGCSL